MDKTVDVAIVGAGLAGLCCAKVLHERGVSVGLFDQADEVGGRIRTDEIEGFLLDRGFQVLLTAYPEANRVLDMKALNLKHFESGSLIRYKQRFHRLDDPFRAPLQALQGVLSPVGSLFDRLNVLLLRNRVVATDLKTLMAKPEVTTLKALQQEGFSEAIIEPFFRPFLGGIFLDPTLQTSSRMFDFVFRMFSLGTAVLPQQGMGAIPKQIAAKLPPDALHLNCAVTAVSPTSVTLASGETVTAKAVVVATDAHAAAQLIEELTVPAFNQVYCFYYESPASPIKSPILVLNGEGKGFINNLCVSSLISTNYAPPGKHLVSVTVLRPKGMDMDTLSAEVMKELTEWFGPTVKQWRPLKHYFIPNALPAFRAEDYPLLSHPVVLPNGVYVCGDYRESPSIEGTMISGRKAAEAILSRLN